MPRSRMTHSGHAYGVRATLSRFWKNGRSRTEVVEALFFCRGVSKSKATLRTTRLPSVIFIAELACCGVCSCNLSRITNCPKATDGDKREPSPEGARIEHHSACWLASPLATRLRGGRLRTRSVDRRGSRALGRSGNLLGLPQLPLVQRLQSAHLALRPGRGRRT